MARTAPSLRYECSQFSVLDAREIARWFVRFLPLRFYSLRKVSNRIHNWPENRRIRKLVSQSHSHSPSIAAHRRTGSTSNEVFPSLAWKCRMWHRLKLHVWWIATRPVWFQLQRNITHNIYNLYIIKKYNPKKYNLILSGNPLSRAHRKRAHVCLENILIFEDQLVKNKNIFQTRMSFILASRGFFSKIRRKIF